METLTLTELGARMCRRWKTLLAGGLIGLSIGTVAHLALPTRFEATTVLLVEASDPQHVDMAAEAAVAGSRRVTSEALDALGDDTLTIRRLETAATATVVTDSRLLRITYVTGDPQTASRGADAVAHAYLAARAVDRTRNVDRPVVEGTVVDPARTPTSPVGPGLMATILGTTVLGVLAAAPLSARPTRRPADPAS